MANIDKVLDELLDVSGATAAAVVDFNSGMMLGGKGSGVDLELAAGGNTQVVKSKLKTMEMLHLNDEIEDILITLTNQFHLIRPTSKLDGLFLYYVLDNAHANLALARRALKTAESKLVV
ncbi:MAG: hypothetical protein KTR17_08335 [Cellvibrionaceae bacterium]|nr:hypothetical protein [Cellvibrionaceae bacterium]